MKLSYVIKKNIIIIIIVVLLLSGYEDRKVRYFHVNSFHFCWLSESLEMSSVEFFVWFSIFLGGRKVSRSF